MCAQLFHPFESQKYRKSIQELRAVGRKCIVDRIALLERGEPLPNDILSCILKIASEFLHTSEENVHDMM